MWVSVRGGPLSLPTTPTSASTQQSGTTAIHIRTSKQPATRAIQSRHIRCQFPAIKRVTARNTWGLTAAMVRGLRSHRRPTTPDDQGTPHPTGRNCVNFHLHTRSLAGSLQNDLLWTSVSSLGYLRTADDYTIPARTVFNAIYMGRTRLPSQSLIENYRTG